MNHVRFMIGPELYVVQDEVQGIALHPIWCRTYPPLLRGRDGWGYDVLVRYPAFYKEPVLGR